MDDRFDVSGPSVAVPDETRPGATKTPASSDGPPNEIDLGSAVEEEIDRLVHHPRAEASRIHRVEEAGESGATPYLYLLHGLKIVLPAGALMLAVALLAYHLS